MSRLELMTADQGSPDDTAPAAQRSVEHLRVLVERGRRRWIILSLLEAGGLAVAVPLAYLWLVFLLDNVVHFSPWGRLLANIVFSAVVAVLLLHLWGSWRRARHSEDEVALAIERRTRGGVENRLINAIQLARSAATPDPEISRAVVEENYRQLLEIQLEQSAGSRPAILRVTAAAALIVAGLCFWMFGQERFTNAASRIFLPLADIEPVYKTRLSVSPGDVTIASGGDVKLTISIDGDLPAQLVLLTDSESEQESQQIAGAPGSRMVRSTIKSVQQSMRYAVRGGDYTTKFFTIHVPTAIALERLSAAYHFPEYTNLADRLVDSASGDLEALRGTQASLTFTFNAPVEQARLFVEKQLGARTAPASKPPNASAAREPGRETRASSIELRQIDGQKFATEMTFDQSATYRIECVGQAGKVVGPRYAIVATADAAPTLELSGIEPGAQPMVDSVLPLELSARDDFGLTKVGLFYRRLPADSAARAAADRKQAEWMQIQSWSPEGAALQWSNNTSLPLGMLEAAEGEQVELALRARDNDPQKRDWTTGPRVTVSISGAGVDLQVTYERILRAEAGLRRLVAGHEQVSQQTTAWTSKLSAGSAAPLDDLRQKLGEAMKQQVTAQRTLREQAAEIARQMVEQSGSLRLSVGMLADTEMVRSVRILETVSQRDTPLAMRGALADAQLTQERTIRSLHEILDEHVRFREDWELSHMLAFTKMLAQRQESMAEASRAYAAMQGNIVGPPLRKSVSRRQTKLLELSGLAQTAFKAMQKREELVGPIVARAFAGAADAFDASGVKTQMRNAAESVGQGQWIAAEPPQRRAAEALTDIYSAVHAAQVAAGQQALDKLQKLAASSAEVQKELQKLQADTNENLVDYDAEKLKLSELIRMRKVTEDLERKRDRPKDKLFEVGFDERMKGLLTPKLEPGKGQDFSILTLANKPSGQMSIPGYSDQKSNRVNAAVQEEVEDLVGKLLEEADDLRDQYETYNINAAIQTNEPGDVGKQGGALNSTAASAATGNMKPPTHNFGGASRTGRQGARAHGLVVGDNAINRRGRDKVQEGQEDVADQAGKLKQTDSDDPQLDASTGRGGKMTDAKQTQHSTANAGQFEDKDVERMQAPQQEYRLVERKGPPIDPKLAEMMRDLSSNQEQVIERIKALKKELDQLYLPTDHLEDIMGQLAKNLDRLKDKPAAEIFRQQAELLEKLQGVVIVFNRPSSQYEQALPRQQSIKGRILDEPAVQPLPGYEEAVNRYYEILSGM